MSFFRPRSFDFIGIGDSVLDTFLTIEEASVACELKRDVCQLCLAYGEKIPLKAVMNVYGAGNSSNTSIGASRLGWKTAIVSIVGDDATGRQIQHQWKSEKVSTEFVQIDAKHETNHHTVLDFKGERTILVYHEPRTYHLPRLPKTDWIYYSSMGKGHEKLEKQLLTYLADHPKTQVAFNPGTYQLRRGLKSLKAIITRTTVFAVNKQEAERLLEKTSDSFGELALPFIKLGAKYVVITDGENGSYATNGKELWKCGVFPGKVIERTGAGDSYALGFVFGLHETNSIPDAMRYGTANSWSVVQHTGPHKGLLTKEQMHQTLRKFHRIQPKLMRLSSH